MTTHSSILPRESQGRRSMVGYRPWGCKESDVIEHTHAVTHMLRSLLDAVKGKSHRKQ